MKLIIRAALPSDIGGIQRIYSHYVLNGLASFELRPPDEVEMLARWQLIKERGHPYLVVESEGALAGYAYASTYRRRPAYDYTLENSVYISHEYLGMGAGKRILDALVEKCTELGFRQLIAVIGDSNNYPSINLHLKCGFEKAGVLPSTGFKHGRWVDSVLMQCPLGDGDRTLPS